jgi:protoporphyrinogen oxidase
MTPNRKILIIGGGFTGLTAALRLSADSANSVTVIESADHLGGLAAGFSLHGTSLERTYHHLFLTDESILSLVGELGLSNQLMWCDSSVGIYRDGKIHSFKTPLDLLRFSPCNLLGRVRTGVTALYLKHRKDWRNLAPQSAHTWMARACGPSAMETIWTPLLKGKFSHHYRDVSMAWFWARIHIRANSRSGGGGEKLGYFCGGFQIVINAMERILRERGVRILLNQRAEQVSSNRTVILDGQAEKFDACVFTGASRTFSNLLPVDPALEAYKTQLRSIDYIGAVCMVFTSVQDLGNFYWVNINEPGAPFLVFLNHTRLIDASHYQGRHVYYLGAYTPADSATYRLDDAALKRSWWDYLKKMFPQFDTSRVEQSFVFRFNAAQHIVDSHYEQKIPDHRTPLPGVYLANFSQIFPEDRGTNYAVREGNAIARMVLEDLKAAGTALRPSP